MTEGEVWRAEQCDKERDSIHLTNWLAKEGHDSLCWRRDEAYYIWRALSRYFETPGVLPLKD